jgi:hypothetical protein
MILGYPLPKAHDLVPPSPPAAASVAASECQEGQAVDLAGAAFEAVKYAGTHDDGDLFML